MAEENHENLHHSQSRSRSRDCDGEDDRTVTGDQQLDQQLLSNQERSGSPLRSLHEIAFGQNSEITPTDSNSDNRSKSRSKSQSNPPSSSAGDSSSNLPPNNSNLPPHDNNQTQANNKLILNEVH